MAFIHARGIAHLDLKTTNILLTDDKRRTVIADFGISQTRDGFGGGGEAGNPPSVFSDGGVEMPLMSAAPVHFLALTPQYCAPERLLRKDLTFTELLATDVYTFGVFLLCFAWSVFFFFYLGSGSTHLCTCTNPSSPVVASGVVVWVIYAQVEPFAGLDGAEVMAAIRADPSMRHEVPAWTDTVAAGLVRLCWDEDGTVRPTFDNLRDVLTGRYCGGEIGGIGDDVFA